MRLAHPTWLVLEVLPVALAWWYVRLQRRRAADAVRWTNLAAVEAAGLLDARQPRRHVGVGAVLVGLVVLVVAITGPYSRTRVRIFDARVVVALDTSISMGADDVDPTRIEAAAKAIDGFLAKSAGVEVGLVTFSGTVTGKLEPSRDRGPVQDAIDDPTLGEGTAIGDAIAAGIALLQDAQGPVGTSGDLRPSPGSIILISDGGSTAGRPDSEAIDQANRANVRVATIAYGTPQGQVDYQGQTISVPVDPAALTRIAEATNGAHFEADSGSSLEQAFGRIARGARSEEVPHEVTDRVAALAFVLIAFGLAVALRHGRRLV